MRVVDSSAWLEWFMSSPVGDEVGAHLPDRTEWVVPTIVQLELAKWLSREVNEQAAEEMAAFTQLCMVIPLTTSIALEAAELCRMHGLSTADGVIYATALAVGADVLTCDSHFSSLPRVLFVSKNR